jgi:hypothetical protein
MVNMGRPDGKVLSDSWTAMARDRRLSARFGHSSGVTENGCEIFTCPLVASATTLYEQVASNP